MPLPTPPPAKERIRKPFLAILCAALAIACGGLSIALIEARATPKPLPRTNSSDLDSNGYIKTGWMRMITDTDMGDCPSGLYALANMRLEELASREDLLDEKGRSNETITNPNDSRQFRGINPEIQIYIVPTLAGYEFNVLSSRRLTEFEKDRIQVFSKAVIENACDEWNRETFHRKGWIP